MDKLRAKRGETLVETLAAILIVTLASVVLLTTAMTAARVNQAAGDSDTEFQEKLRIAEEQTNSSNRSVAITMEDSVEYRYNIEVFGGEDGLRSYAYSAGGGGAFP